MRLGDFEEGARVRLDDPGIEEECNGTVVELVVKEVRVRFDDGETITLAADDEEFVHLDPVGEAGTGPGGRGRAIGSCTHCDDPNRDDCPCPFHGSREKT